MTKDEIKKALKCCSNPSISYCKGCPYANCGKFDCCNGKMCKDALNLITEQEKSIQVAQDSILSLAQQNQEYREQQVKQAKIDVLNKLKERLYSIFVTKSSPLGDITVEDIAEDIDELMAEVQNE